MRASDLLSPPLPRAMSSEKNKELFLRQVEQILDSVKQDKERVRSEF